jgi:hypothetical protein
VGTSETAMRTPGGVWRGEMIPGQGNGSRWPSVDTIAEAHRRERARQSGMAKQYKSYRVGRARHLSAGTASLCQEGKFPCQLNGVKKPLFPAPS